MLYHAKPRCTLAIYKRRRTTSAILKLQDLIYQLPWVIFQVLNALIGKLLIICHNSTIKFQIFNRNFFQLLLGMMSQIPVLFLADCAGFRKELISRRLSTISNFSKRYQRMSKCQKYRKIA